MPQSEQLFGRDAELQRLRERLHAAHEGRGGLIVLAGEAGIGKSALASALAGEAEQMQFRVVHGRAWEFADAPAYFPVRSGLRALGVAPALPAASDSDAFGLWEDVLEALARECARTPLCWVIEDVHAADAQSLELLVFLAQPLRALAALVLVTVRTGDSRASGAVLQRMTRLVRDGGVIELERLGEADVVALAERVARRSLPTGSVAAWIARTGGNPLFVVECARALRAGRSVESALPDTIVQVVLERLRMLAPETRAALEQGAVLGREFAAAVVARLSARLPAEVIDRLLPALRAGLIEETAPGRFRFGHALVRDAIYGAMPAGERRACHAHAEQALAEQGELLDVLVERARHAIEGLGVTTEAHAQALVERALQALEREGARDRAFALWRRWLDARAAKPDASALLELARLATAAGNHREAQRAAEAAGALARAAGDAMTCARAALVQTTVAPPGAVDADHVRVLEQALALLPAQSEPQLSCLLRARLAAAMQPSPTPHIPVAMARQALVDARQIGDPTLLREVLLLAGSALTYYVPAEEAHAVASELLSLSLQAGDSPRALRALVRRAISHVELGDIAAFDADVDHALLLARAIGHPAQTWRALIVGSMRAVAHGQFDESERLVTELEQMAVLVDDPALLTMLMAHKLYRLFALDDEAELRKVYRTIVPQVSQTAGEYGASIRALFATRLREREAVALELPALLRSIQGLPEDSQTLGLAAEAVAFAGTKEQREAMLRALQPLAQRSFHTAPVPQTYEGPIVRLIGLLEAALGNIQAADVRLEAAREVCRAHGLRPWLARISLERGLLLLDAGRSAEGRALCAEAAALAAELGMRGTEARARRTLEPAHVEPEPTPLRVELEVEPVMLAREGEVWCARWAGHVARVRDSRGVQLLAKLIVAPGERIHALALAADGESYVPDSDAGEVVDAKAVAAYRARLSTIDEALAVAEARSDGRRMEQYRREREALVAEITRAVGLGGRLRKVGSATERARINVTRRLKDAVARIAEASPEIGRHLELAIRTGTYCSYREKS